MDTLHLYLNIDDGSHRAFKSEYVTMQLRVGPPPGDPLAPDTINKVYHRDLSLRAQWDAHREAGEWYSFEPQYSQPHSVTLRQCENMVKTLRLITRRLDRMYDKLGRPEDIVDHVERFAQAVGASAIRIDGVEYTVTKGALAVADALKTAARNKAA